LFTLSTDGELPKRATLCIGLSYFNQVNCLRRMLASLEYKGKLIPHMIAAVDGAYKGFCEEVGQDNFSPSLSTDGSRELLDEFAKKHPFRVSQMDAPLLNERDKRQRYVSMATAVRAEFLLIVDADEWLECDDWRDFWEELDAIICTHSRNANIFGVRMEDLSNDGRTIEQGAMNVTWGGTGMFRPRLWYRPEEISYFDTHWKFGRASSSPSSSSSVVSRRTVLGIQEKLTSPIVIKHCHGCNDAKREEQRRIYESDILPRLETPQ
jgi:hypothetical protein